MNQPFFLLFIRKDSVGWRFKPSQPQRITSGLKDTFIKICYIVEWTNRAERKPVEQSENAKSCRENLWNEAGIACWLERRTRDRNRDRVRIPAGAAREFFSPESTLRTDLIRCPFHPRVTAVACKRPRSFCKKCRWQATPKDAYTIDQTKSEWAVYSVVQA